MKLFQPIRKLVLNAKQLNPSSLFVEVVSLKKVQDRIIELNTKVQLGFDRTDDKGNLLPRYSATTEELSGGEKKQGEPYNLLDTGDFYGSFKIDLNGDSFDILANTIKFDETGESTDLDDYAISGSVVGLTDENLQKLIEEIKPLMIKPLTEMLLKNVL